MTSDENGVPARPKVVDRATLEAEIGALRTREKAHTREADAIAAARRRLPVVEIDASTPVVGAHGAVPLIDVFEGRSQLFASYMMWYGGASAAHQCEGCTMNIGHVLELGYLHSRDVTFAVLCQGPFDESNRYREFMEWEMPWYSVPSTSVDALIAGRHFGMRVCYLRDDNRVFETYWTTGRGCELMGSSYAMLDMTVYGRQEAWEDSPRAGRNASSTPRPLRCAPTTAAPSIGPTGGPDGPGDSALSLPVTVSKEKPISQRSSGKEPDMELRIVNPDPRYSKARLSEPTTLGYIHLAAEVSPRPIPPQRLPFLLDNRAKVELLGKLKAFGYRPGLVLQVIELRFWFDAALRELVKPAPTGERAPPVPADALA